MRWFAVTLQVNSDFASRCHAESIVSANHRLPFGVVLPPSSKGLEHWVPAWPGEAGGKHHDVRSKTLRRLVQSAPIGCFDCVLRAAKRGQLAKNLHSESRLLQNCLDVVALIQPFHKLDVHGGIVRV